MKTLNQWLSAYGVCHQNKTNQIIHKICVPLIYWSIVGLIGCLPAPEWSKQFFDMFWVWIILIPLAMFYFRLNWQSGTVMIFLSLICLYTAAKIDAIGPSYLLYTSIVIFVVGWVGQFIGHKIEGKKPSFFEDLSFLLIGPLWVFKSVINNKK